MAIKVLNKLGVIGPQDTSPVEYTTLVEETYDEVWEELSERRIVTWGSTDEIPTEAIKSVVYLVAAELVGEFEVPGDKARNIQSGALRSEGLLRRLAAVDYVSAPVKFVDY